ncbi:MAG: tannase/feruloyl esterase family alpha/beta hydrolase [Ideonella sp.]|nr:tannase/feruloyl esterase family alpha/beta hydrolase [Ideonella sp.]
MQRRIDHRLLKTVLVTGTTLVTSACGGSDAPVLPTLAAATPGTLQACTDLATKAALANTTIASSVLVAAGGLTVTGVTTPMPEHCLVKGEINRRTSAVDGKSYAIGFEMRLPTAWNGRFFYQANGGIDGSVVTATGPNSGGAPLSNALQMGFAVISSDAGHAGPPWWGLDPQARLDYGYQAVGSLTPMAKALIKTAYGKAPDRSYFGGCSNGGRHAMVAAARYADQYDGILAGAPGLHLPKAATAQLWKVQQYASIATSTIATGADAGQKDITSAVTPAEFKLLGDKIMGKCDALDGAVDGIVSDIQACQGAFNLATDVPTCTGARDGSCLSAAQKTVLGNIFAGARNSKGEATYSNFYYDPGVAGSNHALWHYSNSTALDPGAVAFIFTTPPSSQAAFLATTGLKYGLAFNMDTDHPKMFATDATYKESPWSYMTPPNETDLSTLRSRGAKLLVYHGAADPIFSAADTSKWYEALQSATSGEAAGFARYFIVPGMNHCSGGPATDQFDMISQLVNWVEKAQAPELVVAKVRGAGANVVNTELPASWGAARSRPLCAYPKVARYSAGDLESAASFSCK